MQQDYDRILNISEECISPKELKALIMAKGRGSGHKLGIQLYDGFEPSGRMHIAQGLFKAMLVNKCTYSGMNSTFVFWVADWFALMNDKVGGDIQKIKTVGEYLIEVWKAAGMNLTNVVFKWASEEITKNAHVYWPAMLDVARRFNVTRIKKCCQIMGRLEGSLSSAQILYPLMQCTDIFFLKADICQLGMDQRKVNMLAREYCNAAGIKHKPVIVSHHMLYGLKSGQEKMSKSDPDSAVFMEDTAIDVKRKIMNAHCPSTLMTTTSKSSQMKDSIEKNSMQLTEDTLKNPCLDYVQNIIFCSQCAKFTVGDTTYKTFPALRADFLAGNIREEDLKISLIKELNMLLEPVREHFNTNSHAKELLERVQHFKHEKCVKLIDNEIQHSKLVSEMNVNDGCHVVFAPFPSTKPSLQEAAETLAQLRLAQFTCKSIILFIPDWTSRACNKCDSNPLIIEAFYKIFITSLYTLDCNIMQRVSVIKQSCIILTHPSNYWINVINVGRYFMLDDVMGCNVNDSDDVGIVIGRLMEVVDVIKLEPLSIALPNSDNSAVEETLIRRYYNDVLKLPAPRITILHPLNLSLQKRCSQSHKMGYDEYHILDDPLLDGKSKMKRAFCEPGNVQFCPPITIIWLFGPSDIAIKRSSKNGGNRIFKTKLRMENDFKYGSLHPSDLKTTATSIILNVLRRISENICTDPDALKAKNALKNFEKKAMKRT